VDVLLALAVVLVLVGFAGTILPALPGVPLIFAGLAVAAWSDGFARVGFGTLSLLLLLTLVSVGLDVMAASFATRKLGASRAAAIGALVGTLLGLPFGLVGLFVGPFVGAALCEYWSVRDLRRAGTAGAGGWLGLALAVAARFAVAFTMLGLFALAWFL
jgi:uncharacterized protein YqgC (DUF456 family)